MTDLTGRSVIVVEDLFYLAMEVQAVLKKAGATVIGPFSTSAAALQSLAKATPHFGVLDVNLGEGASFDVARALRNRSIPFLLFTGYDASGIPAEFADVPRLEKPVNARRLLDAICAADTSTARLF